MWQELFARPCNEDDIPIPTLGGGFGAGGYSGGYGGFGGFLNNFVKNGSGDASGSGSDGYGDVSGSSSNSGVGSAASRDGPPAPVLRSPEAADALDLWAGAAGRLFAGEAEPLVFRGGYGHANNPRHIIHRVLDPRVFVKCHEMRRCHELTRKELFYWP